MSVNDSRRYTIEEVVESLQGRGLDITTPTLNSYLQRAKATKNKGQKAPRGTTGTTVRTGASRSLDANGALARVPAKPSAASAPDGSRPAADAAVVKPQAEPRALRSGKNAFLINDKDSY